MHQYIYLYKEHMYIDNLPNGIEGERAFIWSQKRPA